jgi:hypothetical protein
MEFYPLKRNKPQRQRWRPGWIEKTVAREEKRFDQNTRSPLSSFRARLAERLTNEGFSRVFDGRGTEG